MVQHLTVFLTETCIEKIYKNIFIPPFLTILEERSGAILGHSRLNKSKNRFINKRLKHNYWGPEFKNAEIEKYLKITS